MGRRQLFGARHGFREGKSRSSARGCKKRLILVLKVGGCGTSFMKHLKSDNLACRYIVVGPARSGTTVVHLCLMGHPAVSAFSDEVKPGPLFTKGTKVFSHGNESDSEHVAGFLFLFDALALCNANENTRACGVKTAIGHPSEALVFLDAMRDYYSNVKIVLTIRHDIVAQFGSLKRAMLTGYWHSWNKPSKVTGGMLKIDLTEFRQYVMDYLLTNWWLQKLKETHPVIEINYETDLLPGGFDVYKRLFTFLEIENVEIDWLDAEKISPPPEEYITNYTELTEIAKSLCTIFNENPAAVIERHQAVSRTKKFFDKVRNRFPS